MQRRPLLAVASAFAFGCLLGGELGAPDAHRLLLLAGLSLGLALTGGRAGAAALLAAAVAIGAAGAGVEREGYEATPLRSWLARQPVDPEPVHLSGVTVGDAADLGDRYVLTLDVRRVGDVTLPGRVRIEVGGAVRRPDIGDGERVGLWARLRPPRGFGTPGAFDTEGQARHQGLVAFGYCKSLRLVTREGPGQVGWLRETAALARRAARRVLRRFVLAGPEEGLVRAMVLGDRTGVDETTAETFRVAGTYHVLALSGAQVALVGGLMLAGLGRVRASPLVCAGVVSVSLAFYALLVGGDVPVVRAAVMATVLVGGRALDLDGDLANLLGLAALALLAHRPSNVLDVGFQLSFAGTLGILLLGPVLLAGVRRMPLRLEVGILGSLAAQAALVPLLAGHFHRLTPLAVMLNLLAVPLSGAVLLAGLGVLAAAIVLPPVAPLAGDVAWIAAHALRRSSEPALLLPQLDVRVPAAPLMALVLYAAGLALALRGRRARGLGLAAFGLVGIAFGPASPPGDGRLHLSVVDVGQGDCLVVRSPRGRIWFVDAGGSFAPRFDVGESVVGPYLWWLGTRRVQGMVLTHAHPDHVGAAASLTRAFRVGEVWEGPAPRRDPAYRALDAALRTAGVTRRSVARGLRADWDGIRVEVLGPKPSRRPAWRTRNDDSLVLSLRLGDVGFLLAGDVEAPGEAQLGVSPAALLKVPHHGSRSSSSEAFVHAVSPKVAVISVGARNPFSHPHPEVVARYERSRASVFRTYLDGTVTVSTDGTTLWLTTFRSGRDLRIP